MVNEGNSGNTADENEEVIEDVEEYTVLANELDLSILQPQIVNNNQAKRIILFKDDHGKSQFKSIYIKKKESLKIIDLHGGLIFNDNI